MKQEFLVMFTRKKEPTNIDVANPPLWRVVVQIGLRVEPTITGEPEG